MNLFKTSLFNGIAVALRLTTSLVLNKLLAVYVGPAGYAVVGQFQSVISMLATLSGGAFNTGVTKYVAEHQKDVDQQRRVWQTASALGIGSAVVLGLGLILGHQVFSLWLLKQEGFGAVMVWLGLALPLFALNGLLLAIMNGRKQSGSYIASNIIGNLMSAGLAATLIIAQGIYGALLAVAVSQAVACVATAFFFRRACLIPWSQVFGRVRGSAVGQLGQYALMAATTAIAIPLSHLAIREYIGDVLGWETSGLWQAMWRISETHLMLLTTTLTLYFLPRYAEIRNGSALYSEVVKGYRFVVPLVCGTSLVIFLWRDTLISFLLSAEFLPIADALRIQLLGDVFKIASWVTAFTMISHARTRTFMVTEVSFAAILAFSTTAMASRYGLNGAAIGYAMTYLVYWIVVQRLFSGLIRSLR